MENRYDAIMDRLEWYYLPQRIEATEDAIKELEKRLGATLPADYVHFLQKYGVTAHKKKATFFDLNEPSSPAGAVGVFYGLTTVGDAYDLDVNWRGFVDRPSGYLPIADSPGGQICLGLLGPNRGKVYYWLTDVMEGELGDPEQALELIGHDFDSFMKSLLPHEKGE